MGTYKSVKPDILWASRLLISAFAKAISLHYFIKNSLAAEFLVEKLHYPWFCKDIHQSENQNEQILPKVFSTHSLPSCTANYISPTLSNYLNALNKKYIFQHLSNFYILFFLFIHSDSWDYIYLLSWKPLSTVLHLVFCIPWMFLCV